MKKKTMWPIQTTRLIRLIFHVLSGILQSIVYPYLQRKMQQRMMKRWAAGVLKILNIELHCTGDLPTCELPRVLFAANHVSWLDICLIMAACPTQFVAKSEIRKWPIIGFLCVRVDTLFIEKAKRSDTRRLNQEIGNTMIDGKRVCVFPEGTTSDGEKIYHFHASLFQSAVNTNAVLVPVAIRYLDALGNLCKDASYADVSLVISLQKILSQPRIEAILAFNEAIYCEGINRRELARLSEQAIANSLSLPTYHKESEKPSYLPGA